MLLLGIDVCSGACSVALLRSGETVAALHEPMTRGHVERLAPMVAEVLAAGRIDADDLDGIAVTTGPGSFTGARLGVAFARGLSFAAAVPVTGVSVFDVMATGCDGTIIVALPGKNGAFMLQTFAAAHALGPPGEYPAHRIAKALPANAFDIIGPARDALFEGLPGDIKARATLKDWAPVTAEAVARTAIPDFTEGRVTRPAPLYLRAPDAKPQGQAARGS